MAGRFAGFLYAGLEPVQQRGAESQCLAGARACLADQVGAAQRQGYGKCLNGKWIYDAGLNQCRGDFFTDTEIGKRLGGGCLAQGET